MTHKKLVILIVSILLLFPNTACRSNFSTQQLIPATIAIEPTAIIPEQDSFVQTNAGGTFITYILSEGIGRIAVQVILPEQPRYKEGASIVVEVNTFLTDSGDFKNTLDVSKLGMIQVGYLWNGTRSKSTGVTSEGEFDYAQIQGIQVLRDVLLYATGQLADVDGAMLADKSTVTPLYDNVGVFAFSHPGLATVNVMAQYGNQLRGIAWFVGRENPTVDTLTAVEAGYFTDSGKPALNPFYEYPDDYATDAIHIPYDLILWDDSVQFKGYLGAPFYDLNKNGILDDGDYPMGNRVPAVSGKRMYSTALIKALVAHGELDLDQYPIDLAKPEEVETLWAFYDSPSKYALLSSNLPQLKVMLVFADRDHVQPAPDKPHIHQAFDGLHNFGGLWVRLNPDWVYVNAMNAKIAEKFSEHPANHQPEDWLTIEDWGHQGDHQTVLACVLAAVAEMADRQYTNNWDDDLQTVLR